MNKKETHLRLGLERSSTATEALETITSLLEKYGQGGPCSKNDQGFVYHNSYLIADNSCAWVLETCGKHWAAEHITSKICFNVIFYVYYPVMLFQVDLGIFQIFLQSRLKLIENRMVWKNMQSQKAYGTDRFVFILTNISNIYPD